MKEFLYLRNGLRSLQPSTRIAYTLFLVFSLLGYGVMVALAADRSGFTTASAAEYYAGGGDAYPKTKGELLELTHFHLFSMPLLLFVQGHLFLMIRWPRRLKLAVLYAAFLGCALDLAAPWLTLYISSDLAVLKNVARALLGPSLLAFAILPLWEMWSPARKAGGEGNDSDPRLGVP
ncbi:MAG: hypothetical protein ACKVXR_05850 [Planctomycetota bacterium]